MGCLFGRLAASLLTGFLILKKLLNGEVLNTGSFLLPRTGESGDGESEEDEGLFQSGGYRDSMGGTGLRVFGPV